VFSPPFVSGTSESSAASEALFYSDDAFLLDELTRFVEAALKTGNAAIVVATQSHREKLLPRLHANGLDIGAAIEQRRYIALDADEMLPTLVADDMFDSVQFLESFGSLILRAANPDAALRRHVAVFGEGTDLLWKRGNVDAAIQDEKLCNELTKRYDVDFLCGYALGSVGKVMDDPIFQRICAEHSAFHSR
jgi:hypothetical protein